MRQRERDRQRRQARRIKEGAGRPRLTAQQREASRLRKKEYDRLRRQGRKTHDSIHGSRVHSRYVPDHVLEDRERRESAPDTPNSAILGDPVTPRWMSNADSKHRHPNFGLGDIRGC